MPRPRTKKEDIIDKERYFRAWLRFEKLNFHKKQAEIEKYEFSVELAIENDKTFEYLVAINKYGECFEFFHKEYLTPIEWIEDMENIKLKRVLHRLTKHQQDILFILFYKGLSQKEASEKLEVSPAAISIQIKRIIEKLKKDIKNV
ncbi:MAG: sigma-70 family RNA polymerase sigma factor [Oscillospiraceae bacterium]|nr:sigma-70 family RNA polymerase sigma factor [Oscillospiraceae bacterium]